jgi:hypothetical protein
MRKFLVALTLFSALTVTLVGTMTIPQTAQASWCGDACY